MNEKNRQLPAFTPRNRRTHPISAERKQLGVDDIVDHCMIYVDGRAIQGWFDYESGLKRVKDFVASGHKAFMWLSLEEPSEQHMMQVADDLHIHELIVEDAVTAHQRPKVESYDDQIFMVVRSVFYRDHETVDDANEIIKTGEVQMLIGEHFIITIRHRTPMPDLTMRLDDPQEISSYGPMIIAWAWADYLVDGYLRIVNILAEEVDELEEEVFTPGSSFNIEHIYMIKREILEMRHAIDPLAPALRMLVTQHKDMIAKQLRSYLRDVLDHEMVAKDYVANFDERLSSLIDAGVAKISLQQNSDMRAISAYVGMAAVPTLIAGIYGMNFENMPELATNYGYYIVILVMVLTVSLMWWYFRKMNWIGN